MSKEELHILLYSDIDDTQDILNGLTLLKIYNKSACLILNN